MGNHLKICLLMASLMIAPSFAESREKIAVLERANSITSKLLVIAKQRQSLKRSGRNQFGNEHIERLIRQQDSLEVLSRVSSTTRAYVYPGRAEDELVDNVLDVAWRSCLRRIERIGGRAAIRVLEEMELEQRLDGAHSMVHRASLERLKAQERDSPR